MPVTSLTQYAHHRKVKAPVVSRACSRGGRLERSAGVQRGPDGRVCAIDWDLADKDWEANSDYTDAPQRAPENISADLQKGSPSPAPTTLAEASVEEKKWRAQLAELKFRKEAKELVPKSEIKQEWIDILTSIKTKLLGVPSRARQQDPDLTVPQIALFEGLIREALEELADDL